MPSLAARECGLLFALIDDAGVLVQFPDNGVSPQQRQNLVLVRNMPGSSVVYLSMGAVPAVAQPGDGKYTLYPGERLRFRRVAESCMGFKTQLTTHASIELIISPGADADEDIADAEGSYNWSGSGSPWTGGGPPKLSLPVQWVHEGTAGFLPLDIPSPFGWYTLSQSVALTPYSHIAVGIQPLLIDAISYTNGFPAIVRTRLDLEGEDALGAQSVIKQLFETELVITPPTCDYAPQGTYQWMPVNPTAEEIYFAIPGAWAAKVLKKVRLHWQFPAPPGQAVITVLPDTAARMITFIR
jgi:hypothetical protein